MSGRNGGGGGLRVRMQKEDCVRMVFQGQEIRVTMTGWDGRRAVLAVQAPKDVKLDIVLKET